MAVAILLPLCTALMCTLVLAAPVACLAKAFDAFIALTQEA